MAEKYFVKLRLGSQSFQPTKVSTQECEYVADFKDAIKNKFSPELDAYAGRHLILFEHDGITEIDAEETIEQLKEKQKPLIVTVQNVQIGLG